MNDIIKDIRIEDMPSDDMRLVAESCGLDVALKLMSRIGGTSIYIPKNPFALLISRILRQGKDVDYKKIAVATGMTERYVRNIARRVKEANERQRSLFDCDEKQANAKTARD